MNIQQRITPGVYINELNAFPNAVVPVATAVPAFIGYTPQASYEGRSYTDTAQKISSFAEFQAIYCLPDPPPPAAPAKQYSPQYYWVAQATQPAAADDYVLLNGSYYVLRPDPSTIYYLYNSIRLFYQNGGGDAYIVSVGGYGAPSGKPQEVNTPLVNPNVQLADLQRGLALLQNEQEPTMYICPEATLLSLEDNSTLMQAMLQQAMDRQTAICIFDIIGGNQPDPVLYVNDIQNFRNNTGNLGLDYGTAYYPFIGTTLMQNTDLDYTNLFGGDVSQLAAVVAVPATTNNLDATVVGAPATANNPNVVINMAGVSPTVNNPDTAIATILANMQNPASGLTVAQNNQALLAASPVYAQLMAHTLHVANILPPSGAMAGVMTTIDNAQGVWEAPANVGIVGAASLPIRLSDTQQASLNVDAVSGKSINAIRFFNGLGILVWGARTLDGNNLDYRFLSVRRTLIMLEQSCKMAMRSFVFEPNIANTWLSVKSMIASFLTNVWKQGGLQGASAADAFTVACGLGSTMTANDILNSIMRVTIQVAVVHPAEFVVITMEQEMAAS